MIVNALLSHVTSPCGAKRLPMAPLRRRLGRIELYSQIIYNSSDPWITSARTAQDVLCQRDSAARKLSAEASSEHSFDTLIWRQRDRQLAPGLTMTLPFMFGWIKHK
jgi:hypothetical protein